VWEVREKLEGRVEGMIYPSKWTIFGDNGGEHRLIPFVTLWSFFCVFRFYFLLRLFLVWSLWTPGTAGLTYEHLYYKGIRLHSSNNNFYGTLRRNRTEETVS
jgi:hypothetical protein